MDARPPDGSAGAPENSAPSRRFESWKEIAAYFGRDVRTVRRWERIEALPVHRHLHRARGSVYAFQDELDRWLARRRTPAGSPENGAAVPSAAGSARRFSPGALVLLAGISVVTGLTGYAFVVNRAPAVSSSREPHGSERSGSALTDPQIRESFLIAKHQLQRGGGHREQAREQIEAIVGRAPDFAEAHALLGEAYLRAALYDRLQGAVAWPKAEAAVRRALALDVNDATAHAVLSRILLLRDWKWVQAAAEARTAVELAPDAADARSAYALYLRSAGRSAEAIVERERARRSDPLNPQRLVALGDEYAFARRYGDSIQAYHRALEIERDQRPAVASLADVYPRLGRYAEGAFWQSRMLTLVGETDLAAAFDDVRRRKGPERALRWLDRRRLAEFERAPVEHAWDLAYINARLGNAEAALRFLQQACDGVIRACCRPASIQTWTPYAVTVVSSTC